MNLQPRIRKLFIIFIGFCLTVFGSYALLTASVASERRYQIKESLGRLDQRPIPFIMSEAESSRQLEDLREVMISLEKAYFTAFSVPITVLRICGFLQLFTAAVLFGLVVLTAPKVEKSSGEKTSSEAPFRIITTEDPPP